MRSRTSNRASIAIAALGTFALLSAAGAVGGAAVLASGIGWTGTFILGIGVASLLFFALADGLATRRLKEFGRDIDLRATRVVDLRIRLPVSRRDELSSFGRTFNILLAKIHAVVFQLKSIASRGVEIGNDLAAGSEE